MRELPARESEVASPEWQVLAGQGLLVVQGNVLDYYLRPALVRVELFSSLSQAFKFSSSTYCPRAFSLGGFAHFAAVPLRGTYCPVHSVEAAPSMH